MGDFLLLWIQVAIFIEVVKSYWAISREGMAEDLLAQQAYQVGCRWAMGLIPPFWKRQLIIGTLESVGQDRCHE
jgi:hypothetical protein